MAATAVTLHDLEGHSQAAGHFKIQMQSVIHLCGI